MCSLPCRHSKCHQPVAAAVDQTTRIVKPLRFARAVNQLQKSSRRVRYLRSTVGVSNFCKALLLHDFGTQVARESLRREFGKGSLSFGSGIPLPTGSRKTPGARAPGVFCCASPNHQRAKGFATTAPRPAVWPPALRFEPRRGVPFQTLSFQHGPRGQPAKTL